jgi:hypothetical protein
VDGLGHVLVDFIEIVPVMNSFSQGAAGNEGETESDDYSGFLHGASLGWDFILIRSLLSSPALLCVVTVRFVRSNSRIHE